MRSILNKFRQRPVHAALAVLALISLFSAARELQNQQQNAAAREATSRQVQSVQLSSLADTQKEISATNYRAISSMSDSEFLEKIAKTRKSFLNKNFAVSVERIEAFEQRSQKQLPKRFEKNPVFKLLEQIVEGSASTEYEDLIVCDPSRQYYEKQIMKYPKIAELLKPRDPLAANFANECVTYSMKQFNMPRSSFANCPRAMGAAQLPGAKPCVTPNLVNLTYNSFVDVTDCLNINPKLLMPKIDFESGFFLNAYGHDRDSGIGQLTRGAISEVNDNMEAYLAEVEKAAPVKKSCANLMRYREYLTKVAIGSEQRCALMGLPENPLRNIFYSVLLNRINMDKIAGTKFLAGQDYFQNAGLAPVAVQFNKNDDFGGLFRTYRIKEKLEKLGLLNPDLHYFKNVLALAGYNSGVETAVSILSSYLDKRLENNLNVTLQDFDFNFTLKAQDIDGKQKSVVDIARAYIMSSFMNDRDSADVKALKLRRRRELPLLWAMAYTKTFPEYLAYRANTYDGMTMDTYSIYGFPGYVNVIAERNKSIRELFKNSDLDPNLCSDPDFLKARVDTPTTEQ